MKSISNEYTLLSLSENTVLEHLVGLSFDCILTWTKSILSMILKIHFGIILVHNPRIAIKTEVNKSSKSSSIF